MTLVCGWGLRLFFLSPEFDRQLNPIQIETLIELN